MESLPWKRSANYIAKISIYYYDCITSLTYFNTPEVSHERKTEFDGPFADALPFHPRRGTCLRRTNLAIWIQRLALPPKRQLCRNHLSEKDASCAYRGSRAGTHRDACADCNAHTGPHLDACADRDAHAGTHRDAYARTHRDARADRNAHAGTDSDARANRDVHAETDPDARANGSSSLYRRRLYYGFHNGARGKCISFAQSGQGSQRPFRA